MGILRPALMHTIWTIYMIHSTCNSCTRALIYATRGLHHVHSQAHVYYMGYLPTSPYPGHSKAHLSNDPAALTVAPLPVSDVHK